MSDSKVVNLFEWIDELTINIQNNLNEPYLDSLAISLEALYYQDVAENEIPLIKEVIEQAQANIEFDQYTQADIKKATQLAMLKGMQKSTQQQHFMTPEAISLFIGYLADKLTADLTDIRLFDPVSGTGSLLLQVMEQLKHPVAAYASEIDPTLLRLAVANTNLHQKSVEYFHQDSLRPFLLDPVDLVVADLPVGYYPDDVHASTFTLKPKEGHAYAHHLLIEQSLKYLKTDGYLICIVPEFLFESEQAEQLHAFLQEEAQIIGLLQLPETVFRNAKNKKSIFILQKKDDKTKLIKEPLLAVLPSFNDTVAMENILNKINTWFTNAGYISKHD